MSKYRMYSSYGPAVEGRPPNVTNPASLLIGQSLIQPLSSLVGPLILFLRPPAPNPSLHNLFGARRVNTTLTISRFNLQN